MKPLTSEEARHMRNARHILFLLLSLPLASCSTLHFNTGAPSKYWGIVPLSFKEVVSDPAAYSTEKGRRLMVKYERNLQNIFAKVRETYKPSEIEFVPYVRNQSAGLSFMRLSEGDQRFLTLFVLPPFAFFDKGQSTYQDRWNIGGQTCFLT